MREYKSLRDAYGRTLLSLGSKNNSIVALEADLGKSTKSSLFGDKYPDRYFQMGIAEQNMASTAAGLALSGKIPYIHSFAIFASGRAFDQIRNSICVPNLKVRICGSSSGLSDFADGKTHQSLEDVALMRALPGMKVYCPLDYYETEKIVEKTADNDGPVYIRINRNDLPVYITENNNYELGKVRKIRDGSDAVIFANGVMVSQADEAADILSEKGISLKIVNISCIKPLDKDGILRESAGMKAVVAAEEHNVIGGLGSAVAEVIAGNYSGGFSIIGVNDTYGRSAENYGVLLKYYGMDAVSIARRIEDLIKGD